MTDKTYAHKIVHESGEKILKINYEGSYYSPSLEDDANCMARTFNILLETGPVSQIIFLQKEEFAYDAYQVRLLHEIVEAYNTLVREEGVLTYSELGTGACSRFTIEWYEFLRTVVLHRIKGDPIGSYIQLIRRIREERIKQIKPFLPEYAECVKNFIYIMERIVKALDATHLIKLVKPHLSGYEPGDRRIYREIFKPSIRPTFMNTKLITAYPTGAEELEKYNIIENSEVMILKQPSDLRPIYHVIPPEFKMSEDRYDILSEARQIMAEHRPKKSEFIDPERTREIFFEVEKDLITDLAGKKGIELDYAEIEELAKILVRYTIGFGLIEILLSDKKIQDIVVNAPLGVNPISVIHADYGECRTNIAPTIREGESWATKLRLLSGRPLDEANPVLDTSLLVPGGKARVAALQRPLSSNGLAFAFRRHRDRPWTLPLFIQNKMLNALSAGVLSFLMDGARTLLIAGTRSSGKTSLLGALMVEIMRNSRVITIEDTLELPVNNLRKLNYDIQSLKVSSVITPVETEVPADQGIRTSLRLGDSALIIGEVRSKEAKALWEAMRVGALAKVVAGTIHGDSPYGVFDRVVNDLEVPKTSFKATDVIVICNPVSSPSGLEKWRRVLQVTEVRKIWDEDPLKEKGFADLFEYDPKKDTLKPTDALIEGESEIIKAIGGRVKEWAGNWSAIWENINLRAKIKQAVVDAAEKTKDKELLEAEFVVKANDEFHKLSTAVEKETGFTDHLLKDTMM